MRAIAMWQYVYCFQSWGRNKNVRVQAQNFHFNLKGLFRGFILFLRWIHYIRTLLAVKGYVSSLATVSASGLVGWWEGKSALCQVASREWSCGGKALNIFRFLKENRINEIKKCDARLLNKLLERRKEKKESTRQKNGTQLNRNKTKKRVTKSTRSPKRRPKYREQKNISKEIRRKMRRKKAEPFQDSQQQRRRVTKSLRKGNKNNEWEHPLPQRKESWAAVSETKKRNCCRWGCYRKEKGNDRWNA